MFISVACIAGCYEAIVKGWGNRSMFPALRSLCTATTIKGRSARECRQPVRYVLRDSLPLGRLGAHRGEGTLLACPTPSSSVPSPGPTAPLGRRRRRRRRRRLGLGLSWALTLSPCRQQQAPPPAVGARPNRHQRRLHSEAPFHVTSSADDKSVLKGRERTSRSQVQC